MEKENIIQLEDISSLRAEMYDKISHAESLGVFTSKEAQEWENGVDACEEAEHVESLIEIIDSFTDSGLEVMQRIEELATHDLVSSKEGSNLLNQAETSSYQDKIEIIRELNAIIGTTEKSKKSLLEILANKNIVQTIKNRLIAEFHSAATTNKEAVLNKAKSIRPPKESIRNLQKYEENLKLIDSMKIKEARAAAMKVA